ncbi:MAG: 16S rRNA (cytosine(1402)-N(4))-methyltransferase RsmH [Eubacteriaceae bacterium]|jgi:16S rRNA (cytosine1402-N4)-methyltransferase|nr:16S rRNA (cytosine(1402)-N(4))-methyltransferase RsmH [Eubacteriaceae bacterium]
MILSHESVLLSETIEMLAIKESGAYLDMTVGGFGHGREICSRLSKDGVYIGLDLDSEAIQRAREELEGFECRYVIEQSHYKRFAEILAWNGINKLDGATMDLGVSSFQLDDSRRGFSFLRQSPLDMRMDQSSPLCASDVVNSYTQEKLASIISEYGEERFAGRVAGAIAKSRAVAPIQTTTELAEIIQKAIPKKFHVKGRHPATKTFMAIRIEVNDELRPINSTVLEAIDWLAPQGRLAAISFHSLEDRQVKAAIAEKAKGCICPKEFPICTCNQKPQAKTLTKKPIVPSEEETNRNPRSRSAKLRVCEKL